MERKTIIFIGAGHAHLETIKALSLTEIKSHRYILISPDESTFYSGLVPRYVMGDITSPDLIIPSARYAKSKHIQFIKDSIKSIDALKKQITLDSGLSLNFDIASINIGGARNQIPSDCPEQTIYIRPFNELAEKWDSLHSNPKDLIKPVLVVVGGGAAAVEIATALKIRIQKIYGHQAQVHLLTSSDRLCASYASSISNKILKSIKLMQIKVHFNEFVKQIYKKHLILGDGTSLNFDSIFVTTPNIPPNIEYLNFTIKFDEDGFPVTDSKLQLAPHIFALGDCASIQTYKLPKSGVIAVHQGRHLIHSLRAALNNQPLPEFTPRKKQLNILITGTEKAMAVWGSFSIENKYIYKIKSWIDNRYMQSF